MTIVSAMTTKKDERIYIRIAADLKKDFETLAQFKGLKTATLLHTLIVKTIHEERLENPDIFTNAGWKKYKSVNGPVPKKADKIIAKPAHRKSDDAPQTFTTVDGSVIPLYDETVSSNGDGEM